MSHYHKPVLLRESVEGLAIKPDGVYVDATFGGGGHSSEILSRLGEKGRLIAFDIDRDAFENRLQDSRFELVFENFKNLKPALSRLGLASVDGILADFGISSHQIETPMRGFSTRFDGELDMRMNQAEALTAAHIVNTYEASELVRIFRNYGELRNASRLTEAILNRRETQPIKTTLQFKNILLELVPGGQIAKYAAKAFQALRIEVNQELSAIEDFLRQSAQVLRPGGRLCLISYHSLEDRLAKHYIREGRFDGPAPKDAYGNTSVPFKRVGSVITPSSSEISENKRSRSAKLRIAERTDA